MYKRILNFQGWLPVVNKNQFHWCKSCFLLPVLKKWNFYLVKESKIKWHLRFFARSKNFLHWYWILVFTSVAELCNKSKRSDWHDVHSCSLASKTEPQSPPVVWWQHYSKIPNLKQNKTSSWCLGVCQSDWVSVVNWNVAAEASPQPA